MLHYAVLFLVLALGAGALGLGGLVAAKLLFAVFIVLTVVSAYFGLARRR